MKPIFDILCFVVYSRLTLCLQVNVSFSVITSAIKFATLHNIVTIYTRLAQLREGQSAWKDMQGSRSLEKSFNFRECREVGEANRSSLKVLLE